MGSLMRSFVSLPKISLLKKLKVNERVLKNLIENQDSICKSSDFMEVRIMIEYIHSGN